MILPTSWVETTVGKVASLGRRVDLPADTPVGFVPLRLLGTGFLEPVGYEERLWSEVARGFTQFADGDVILAKITPSFENGKAGIPRGLPSGFGAGSTEYIVLSPLDGVIEPEFLLIHFKRSTFLRDGKLAMSGAVGQQRVPASFVRDLPISLGPIAAQRRTVSRLASLVAQLVAVERQLSKASDAADRIRESTMSWAVTGKLTTTWRAAPSGPPDSALVALERTRDGHRQVAPDGPGAAKQSRNPTPPVLSVSERSGLHKLPDSWVWAAASEIVEPGAPIVYGIVQPGPETPDGVRYIRGVDIQDDEIRPENLRRTSADISQRHTRSSLAAGDVLLGIIRSTKVAIVPPGLEGTNITQGTARLRPSDAILPEYLALVLRAPWSQGWLRSKLRGIDMPGLNLADVRRTPIPLPPIEEQVVIVRKAKEILTTVTQTKASTAATVVAVDRIRATLFDWAVRGGIDHEVPEEGNATDLLKRAEAMRSERIGVRQRTRQPRIRRSKAPMDRSALPAAFLAHLLRDAGPQTPEQLWIASGLSIDDFYEILAAEVAAGDVIERRTGLLDDELTLEAVR